jgi:hypothetical protein
MGSACWVLGVGKRQLVYPYFDVIYCNSSSTKTYVNFFVHVPSQTLLQGDPSKTQNEQHQSIRFLFKIVRWMLDGCQFRLHRLFA